MTTASTLTIAKRRSIAALIVGVIVLLPGCSRAQTGPARASTQTSIVQPVTAEKKALIVYLSRTNKTKAIAEFIHERVGGTIIAHPGRRPTPRTRRKRDSS